MTQPVFLGMPTAPPGVGQLRGRQPFPEAARTALGDAQLRRNLAKATGTIRAKRAQVVAELPDWAELRAAGAAIKDQVLANLDGYLVQLEEQVTARGGVVHWARDAVEANRIVTDLVLAAGADQVVKVKSMATQEIGLNEALAGAGIAAWETDLAELIVQLGHDTPSHILVPAIHRNRAEIREIFLREMAKVGLPAPPDLTDEPRALAEAARLHLRRKFLEAKVAVSGANFAVAETGTLAVVESEGNGRMCLTLPRVLITVMGIEKLVPTWRDLEVFLQLLPRSSTGERMNPYTSMWTGVHAGDGPAEFHLVLLDNGRTATLADPQGRSALRCIRCSACLNVCPVYERTGGHAYGSVYPGPIGAVLSPQMTGVADNASLPFASTLCGACYDVCPVAIDIPQMLVHLRSRVVEDKRGASRVPTPEQAVMASAAWTMDSPVRWAGALRAARLGRLLGRRRRTDLQPAPAPVGLDRHQGRPPAPDPDLPRLVGPARARPAEIMSARDEILARVRAATADGADPPAVARDYRTAEHPPGLAGEELLELLVDRLVDYKALVRRGTIALVAAGVVAALTERGARRVAVPDGILPAGLDHLEPGIELVGDDPPLSAADLDALDGVLTGCAVAIAETGTIVLDGGSGQGRRALSLVPDYHLVVVTAAQVVASVPEALARLDPARPQTWISGPSATSDIELDRVEGVHGPRTLEVILCS